VPRDLQRYFRMEARELIDGLHQALDRLKEITPTDEDRRPILRLTHALKGAARIAGHGALADAVHRFEERLGAARLTGIAGANAVAQLEEVERAFTVIFPPDPIAPEAPAVHEPLAEVTRQVREAAAATLDAAAQDALDRLVVEIALARDEVEPLRFVPLERIAMPVSLASLSAVEVVSGAARALVPLEAVRTVIRLAGAAVNAAPGGATVRFDRDTLPLVSLRVAFDPSADVRPPPEGGFGDEEDRFALILESTAGSIALGVRGPGRVVAVRESDWDLFLHTGEALMAVAQRSARLP
jgi:chemotaxis protein histidine kinase CheA